MSNICIVNTFYPPDGTGGAERSVETLAKGLVKKGHKVSVICTSKKTFNTIDIDGINVYGLGDMNIYWLGEKSRPFYLKPIWHIFDIFNFISLFHCYFLLKKISPDILHTNNLTGFSTSIFLAAKLLGIPIAHTLRDYYIGCIHSNAKDCSSFCKSYKYPNRFLSRFVSTVIGNSEFILSWHIDNGYFTKSKKKVIYNAYESDKIALNKNTLRRQKKGDVITFGYIGAISSDKGVDLLCSQFALFQKHCNTKLLIAGSGNTKLLSTLKERYKHDNIDFIGYVNSEDFYKVIDWNIVPSVWCEPLARVCFEPKFFSIPVIASCKGGNPEAINNNKDGFIFNPDIEGDLLQKLFKAKDCDYNIFSQNSLNDSDRFSLSRLVENYENAYKNSL